MRKPAVLITLLLLLLSTQTPKAHALEKIKVVATIHPLADIVKNIGKERVEVTTMLPSGASPHIFEPTSSMMRNIRQSRLFFKIGADLELWADRIIKSAASSRLKVIDLSTGMPLIFSAHGHETDNKHTQHKKHPDPHYWLDPVLCLTLIDKISSALAEADPEFKNTYISNAAAYKKEIESLHKEILQMTSTFTNRGYVTFHSAWAYFSARYKLEILGVIEEAPGREPSPKNISRIISSLKKTRTKVVFAEPQFNPKVAEAIAEEAGAKVVFLDPIGSPHNKQTDTYLKLMRYNAAQIRQAMK